MVLPLALFFILQRPRALPVPAVEGPLAVTVVYPSATDRVVVEDSSFVFGSAGDGRATVTINGQAARVYPNGGFIAWIRYPEESPARLAVVAVRGADTARATLLVQRADRFRPDPARAWIDSTSIWPRGRVWWPRDEPLPLSVRASDRSRVELVLPTGKRVLLAASEAPEPVPDAFRAFDHDPASWRRRKVGDRYEGTFRGLRLGGALGPVVPDPAVAALPPVRGGGQRPVRIEAIRGRDTARATWPLEVAWLDTLPPSVVLDDDRLGRGDTDRIVVGRAHPGASYHWFFPNGTVTRVSGRVNGDLRVRLSSASQAWVAVGDAAPKPAARTVNRAIVGSVTMTPSPDRVTVRIPVARRTPFQVDEDPDELRLTLYGATADVNWLRYGPADSLVAVASWRQANADEVEFRFRLSAPVFGYRASWDRNDLILEIRRPPVIDRTRPLAGRLIVVDPGHPPLGSTGPTGLTEPEANLSVSQLLRSMLEAAGARVLMTRQTARPVELWPRGRFADSVNADAVVSIHNNALPDGLNPFVNSGSSVFYFHPRSLPLARAAQQRLLEMLGQRDLGVGRADLALARPTWMPAILTEGLFMMMPDHEATLRDPDGQRRYARAVLLGLEDFFRGLGRGGLR